MSPQPNPSQAHFGAVQRYPSCGLPMLEFI
jgi:hypothetical protein